MIAYINEEFAQIQEEERQHAGIINSTENERLLSIGERSLKEVLKEVLKETEYEKVLPIAELIDENGSISPSEAKAACGKSDTTTWRYLGILVETGFVAPEGETNNKVYRRI